MGIFSHISIKESIGSGEFGTVHRGFWKLKTEPCKELTNVDSVLEVAIKSTKRGANEEEKIKFLQEAAIMGQFKHSNILRVFGIVVDDPVSHMTYTE